jgi:hypothetical protein
MSRISIFARDFFYSQQMLFIDGLCALKVKGLFDIIKKYWEIIVKRNEFSAC